MVRDPNVNSQEPQLVGLRVFLEAEAGRQKSKGLDRIMELGMFCNLSGSSDGQKNGYIAYLWVSQVRGSELSQKIPRFSCEGPRIRATCEAFTAQRDLFIVHFGRHTVCLICDLGIRTRWKE